MKVFLPSFKSEILPQLALPSGDELGKNTVLPDGKRNYAVFNTPLVDRFVSGREASLDKLKQVLETSNDEKQILETLYVLDRMLDKDVKGIKELYPALARFNNATSPNIQVLLAGIYRKTLVPDAFGPLMSMLIKNTLSPPGEKQFFDPNEEIGGAILEYLRTPSQKQKQE